MSIEKVTEPAILLTKTENIDRKETQNSSIEPI